MLDGKKIEEAIDERLLSIKMDKTLNWNNHVDYLVHKFNTTIITCNLHVLKRAKNNCYLNFSLRKLHVL